MSPKKPWLRTRLALAHFFALSLAGCLYPELTGLRTDGPPDVQHAHDEGPVETIPTFHQCTQAMYVDRSGAGDERTITFGVGSNPFSYSPPCMTIAAGQTVRWMGTFTSHPLEHGVSPADMGAGSPNTPIPRLTEGAMVDVVFPTAGTYPYFCQMHHLAGMTGVIHVR